MDLNDIMDIEELMTFPRTIETKQYEDRHIHYFYVGGIHVGTVTEHSDGTDEAVSDVVWLTPSDLRHILRRHPEEGAQWKKS